MSKNSGGGVSIIIVAILALTVGWFAHQYFGNKVAQLFQNTPAHQATSTPSKPNTGTHEICAQVITPARNPETGDIKEFPTPCDVPKGWEVIQNDIPGL